VVAVNILARREWQRTHDLGARCVEDVARAAGGVKRDEEQRSTVIDAVVADADEVAADDRHGALDRVEVDELRPARDRRLQRHVRTLRHLHSHTGADFQVAQLPQRDRASPYVS